MSFWPFSGSGRSRPQRQESSSTFTRDSATGQPDNVDLDSLNEMLSKLAILYPNHDIGLIREMLEATPDDSRLEHVANMLADMTHPSSTDSRKTSLPPSVERWQRVRSGGYKVAVKRAMDSEFRLLSSSTRETVLFENNFDFHRSRSVLQQKASKSFRVAFLSVFAASPPPLVLSGNEELNRELYQDEILAQEEEDHELAAQLNRTEYEYHDALFECQCCFDDVSWEGVAFCSTGHYFCRSCLSRSVEQVLNSGSSTNLINMDTGSFKCISATAGSLPSSTDPEIGDCWIPAQHLEHFLPEGISSRLAAMVTKHNLDNCGQTLPLLRCPFCPYTVLDITTPFRLSTWKPLMGTLHLYFFLLVLSVFSPSLFPGQVILFLVLCWVVIWISLAVVPLSLLVPAPVGLALSRHARMRARPTWAQMLRCQNIPECGRCSCLKCGREWVVDIDGKQHECSAGLGSEHAFIERRVDEAIKRICPQCHTAFIKDGGCNKMSCRCGYKMCYLCRADIRKTGYNHFCEHFRPILNMKCQECTKCLIYAEPDEKRLIREVRARAQREYWVRVRRGHDTGNQDGDADAGFQSGLVEEDGNYLHGFEAWLYDTILWIHDP